MVPAYDIRTDLSRHHADAPACVRFVAEKHPTQAFPIAASTRSGVMGN
jgi:hypothetical protein